MDMEQAARNALINNMGLKNNESCLILFDTTKKKIADAFNSQAQLITENVKLLEIDEPKVNGEEPKKEVADEMLKFDVIMIVTSRSISHTDARRQAVANGARLASMPSITEDMAVRCLSADYIKIRERYIY